MQADSFIVTLRSPLPPEQYFLAATDGREHGYFVCSQSALPLAPWEARSTSRGGGGVYKVETVRTANWAACTLSKLEDRLRLTIPHGF